MTSSLIDEAIRLSAQKQEQEKGSLDTLLESRSLESGLKAFAELVELPHKITKRRLLNIISFYIAEIDELLARQVNTIIHQERFQRLESSWLGLGMLVRQLSNSENIKLRVLDISWREVVKDFERAIDFDQSHLFKKIYNAEYDLSGGEPYGVILGDYYVPHRPTKDMPHDNLTALQSMCTVAAASFAPFVCSTHPSFFGLDSFAELSQSINFDQVFQSQEYLKWNQFRENTDSRFIGLTVPRVLMRKPYSVDNFRKDGFSFEERIDGNRENYLWGNACYAFGSILINAFRDHGWFADIRGSHRGNIDGGVVKDLIVDDFKTDAPGVAQKFSTDIRITDSRERVLSDIGLVPLCHSKNSQYAIFYSNQSAQGLRNYESEAARANEKLGSMLQYILCVSRFAHYLKVIGRDKIGSLSSASEIERQLKDWLMQFSISSEAPSFEMRAKHPLSESSIDVREIPGKPGVYGCVVQLKPHAQIDQVMTSIKLVTELVAAKV